jgi:uncharacterized protein with von Willebrand factor type A (vWA) domain
LFSFHIHVSFSGGYGNSSSSSGGGGFFDQPFFPDSNSNSTDIGVSAPGGGDILRAPGEGELTGLAAMLRAFRPRVRLDQALLDEVMTLPGTKSTAAYLDRAEALGRLRESLSKGILPRAEEFDWPQDPFKGEFLGALREMEMARFCRRYPALLDTLLKRMLALLRDFEGALEQMQSEQDAQQSQNPPPPQNQQQQPSGSEGGGGQQNNPQEDGEEEDDSSGGGAESDPNQQMQDMMQQLQEQAEGADAPDGKKKDFQVGLDGSDQGRKQQQQQQQQQQQRQQQQQQMQERVKQMTKEMVEAFKAEWAPVMDNLEAASKAFDNLDGLMDGPEGFDLTSSLWKKSGWKEVDDLRKKLENLRELRDLVRELGRGGGKGPKRRAPEELEKTRGVPGMIRSPLVPEETRGLSRSGELSRMMPSEMALLAAGWPRDRRDGNNNINRDGRGASSSSSSSSSRRPGSEGARRLHLVRRAERSLLSYERTGWLEEEPSRMTGRMEVRPAAEMGPIILCLDTSGSMRGARETVAKALALEVLRGANKQNRPAYLYAFSGPSDVKELELKCTPGALAPLLDFLSNSFEGGTDVDAPLELSLQRLRDKEWSRADILMVTDGEINRPSKDVLGAVATAKAEMGLEVHGLLVAKASTEAMDELCSPGCIHIFKSWTAVTDRDAEIAY